jgi:hypothetical protein
VIKVQPCSDHAHTGNQQRNANLDGDRLGIFLLPAPLSIGFLLPWCMQEEKGCIGLQHRAILPVRVLLVPVKEAGAEEIVARHGSTTTIRHARRDGSANSGQLWKKKTSFQNFFVNHLANLSYCRRLRRENVKFTTKKIFRILNQPISTFNRRYIL